MYGFELQDGGSPEAWELLYGIVGSLKDLMFELLSTDVGERIVQFLLSEALAFLAEFGAVEFLGLSIPANVLVPAAIGTGLALLPVVDGAFASIGWATEISIPDAPFGKKSSWANGAARGYAEYYRTAKSWTEDLLEPWVDRILQPALG